MCVHQIDGGPLHPRRRHLAGEGALPDQIVQTCMFTAQASPVRCAAEVGWADRLVRFLRVFGFRLVDARLVGQVIGTKAVGDDGPGLRDRFTSDADAVGAHIGDRPLLVELLRGPHRLRRGHAKLARRFLL